jgi:hypothetical protein
MVANLRRGHRNFKAMRLLIHNVKDMAVRSSPRRLKSEGNIA